MISAPSGSNKTINIGWNNVVSEQGKERISSLPPEADELNMEEFFYQAYPIDTDGLNMAEVFYNADPEPENKPDDVKLPDKAIEPSTPDHKETVALPDLNTAKNNQNGDGGNGPCTSATTAVGKPDEEERKTAIYEGHGSANGDSVRMELFRNLTAANEKLKIVTRDLAFNDVVTTIKLGDSVIFAIKMGCTYLVSVSKDFETAYKNVTHEGKKCIQKYISH